MYDPDAHRYDSWLGNPPMMRPRRQSVNEQHDHSYGPVPKLMIHDGVTMRCFAPCLDQLAGRPCPCTERIKREVDEMLTPHPIAPEDK